MAQINTTYEDLHIYLGEMLGEPYGTYDKWTLPVRNLFLNKAIGKIAEVLRCNTNADNITTVAGSASYDLSVSGVTAFKCFDVDEDKGVRYDNERLDRQTEDEMDIFNPDWKAATSGTCVKYLFDFKTKILQLFPPPDDAKTLEVNNIYIPNRITDVTASPNIPESVRYAASCWTAWKLYQGRRKMKQAEEYKKEYVEEMRIYIRDKEIDSDELVQMTSSVTGFTRGTNKFGA